jgi:hypothetical protein
MRYSFGVRYPALGETRHYYRCFPSLQQRDVIPEALRDVIEAIKPLSMRPARAFDMSLRRGDRGRSTRSWIPKSEHAASKLALNSEPPSIRIARTRMPKPPTPPGASGSPRS